MEKIRLVPTDSAEAEECYAEALRTAPEEQYLRQLYFLFRLEEDKDHAGQIAGTADPDLVRKWDGEFEEGIKAAGEPVKLEPDIDKFRAYYEELNK